MLVPKLRFKEFNEEWRIVKLKDISSSISYGMNASAKEYDGENKYIRITDIDENFSNFISNNLVSPNGKLEDKYIVNANNILFARTGASTGKTYIYNENDGKLYFAGFLIKADIKKDYNAKVIFFQTQTNKYNNWVRLTSMRSGQPGINANEYGNYSFSISSLKEQTKIATFLSFLDRKIALQKQKLEALKEYKKGIINDVFSKNYDKTVRLQKLIKQKSIRNKENNNLKVYSISNKNGFLPQTEHFNDRNVASEDISNYKVVNYNDFAYNPARINVGSIARRKGRESVIISPMYICFKCNDDIIPEYLEYYFESSKFYKEMQKRLEGSVRMCLSYESMSNILIRLPDLKEQFKISNTFLILDKKLQNEELKLESIQGFKKALLQKMFI